ncbi:MAG: hypothetical protein WCP10_14245, partial [Desulfuromonadales bacterium]
MRNFLTNYLKVKYYFIIMHSFFKQMRHRAGTGFHKFLMVLCIHSQRQNVNNSNNSFEMRSMHQAPVKPKQLYALPHIGKFPHPELSPQRLR